MKTRTFGLVLLICAACMSLCAQPENGGCDPQPPPMMTPSGKLNPEYLKWTPEDCVPALQSRIPATVVSARSLVHKPSKGARIEYARGTHAWRKGQADEAVLHLAEAMRRDPDYVQAEAALASIYLQTSQPTLALDVLDRALAIEPNLSPLFAAKASALLMLERLAEAEKDARRAVELDAKSAVANYILGVILLQQERPPAEVERYLTVAARENSKARALLDRLSSTR